MTAEKERTMRFTRPHWLPVVDVVTVSLALLAIAAFLVGTFELWGH